MPNQQNKILFRSQVVKRIANQTYTYVIHLLHLFMELMPGFIRNPFFCLILGKAGKHIFFDYGVYIKFPWLVEIGNHVGVNRGVEFYSDYQGKNKIVIGSNVYISPNVRFHAVGHDVQNLVKHKGGQISVEDNVWIGASAIILPGVIIGEGSVIGAGSVVTKDIPPNSIAVGIPARVISERIELPKTE